MIAIHNLITAFALAGISLTSARATTRQASCDASSLNTTVGTYTVALHDTIFSIAATVNRGVCDIARANRMADATIFNVGQSLLIPAEVCSPDQSTCLLTPANATTQTCIFGGPHTYTTFPNDTIASIALEKFNITVTSLWNTTSRMLTVPDAYSVLDPGNNIKLPQCSPSQCTVQPYHFTYGTYKDLAAQVNASVGQLFAFNPTYNHSNGEPGTGPILTVPMNCVPLAENFTVVS